MSNFKEQRLKELRDLYETDGKYSETLISGDEELIEAFNNHCLNEIGWFIEKYLSKEDSDVEIRYLMILNGEDEEFVMMMDRFVSSYKFKSGFRFFTDALFETIETFTEAGEAFARAFINEEGITFNESSIPNLDGLKESINNPIAKKQPKHFEKFTKPSWQK